MQGHQGSFTCAHLRITARLPLGIPKAVRGARGTPQNFQTSKRGSAPGQSAPDISAPSMSGAKEETCSALAEGMSGPSASDVSGPNPTDLEPGHAIWDGKDAAPHKEQQRQGRVRRKTSAVPASPPSCDDEDSLSADDDTTRPPSSESLNQNQSVLADCGGTETTQRHGALALDAIDLMEQDQPATAGASRRAQPHEHCPGEALVH